MATLDMDVRPAWTQRIVSRKGLRLGVPNTGRLFQLTAGLLRRGLGINIETGELLFGARQGVEFLCARSNDLPSLLSSGVVDLALTGSDYAFESGSHLVELADLGWIDARICLLAAEGARLRGPEVRVATQYPRYATTCIREHLPSASIWFVSGAAELYPRIGLAEAIVDCVETGRTSRANGLSLVAQLARVSVRLYGRPDDTEELVAQRQEWVATLVQLSREIYPNVVTTSPDCS
jgi:ATP phosphoribosyltransferase